MRKLIHALVKNVLRTFNYNLNKYFIIFALVQEFIIDLIFLLISEQWKDIIQLADYS